MTIQLNCRQCQQPSLWHDNPWRPFCSERCRLIDLNGWFAEANAIPCDDGPGDLDQEELLE